MWKKASVLRGALTLRAPGRAGRSKPSECSNGTPPKSFGEATPSSGPVTLLVRLLLSFLEAERNASAKGNIVLI